MEMMSLLIKIGLIAAIAGGYIDWIFKIAL